MVAGNPLFFQGGLAREELWRLFGDFRSSAAHLDIETTSLEPGYCFITTIALFDGKNWR